MVVVACLHKKKGGTRLAAKAQKERKRQKRARIGGNSREKRVVSWDYPSMVWYGTVRYGMV